MSSEQGYLRSDNSLEALYEPHLERFSKSYAEPRASARAESHSERTLAVPDVWYTKTGSALDNANCATEAIRGLKARTALKTAARFHFRDEPIGNCNVKLVL